MVVVVTKKRSPGQHSNLGNEMIKLTFNAIETQIALSKADRGGGGVARCLKELQETKGRVVDKEVGAVFFSSSSFASFEQATGCAESKRVSGPKTVPRTQIAC